MAGGGKRARRNRRGGIGLVFKATLSPSRAAGSNADISISSCSLKDANTPGLKVKSGHVDVSLVRRQEAAAVERQRERERKRERERRGTLCQAGRCSDRRHRRSSSFRCVLLSPPACHLLSVIRVERKKAWVPTPQQGEGTAPRVVLRRVEREREKVCDGWREGLSADAAKGGVIATCCLL